MSKTAPKTEFKLSGQIQISAKINTDLINQKLLGVPKKDAARMMDEFAGISSIVATIRPIWKQSFPQNPSKIHVQVVPVQ